MALNQTDHAVYASPRTRHDGRGDCGPSDLLRSEPAILTAGSALGAHPYCAWPILTGALTTVAAASAAAADRMATPASVVRTASAVTAGTAAAGATKTRPLPGDALDLAKKSARQSPTPPPRASGAKSQTRHSCGT